MSTLPSIPIASRIRWRRWRQQGGPPLVVVLAVVACFFLWRESSTQGALPGIADGVRSLVTSPHQGLLQQVLVQPYDLVQAGQPLAVLQPIDPRAQLDLFQAEVQLTRMRHEPLLAERNAVDFERIRLELHRAKSDLAVARVNLERADNEVRRNEPLYREKLVSEDVYDLSLKTRDAFRAEVEEGTRLVVETEARLRQLQSLSDPSTSTLPSTASALDALEDQRSTLATNWAAITLRAPIDGMVHTLFRQAGEHIVEGEPLITVESRRAQRIIGYLRQPYPLNPEVGMAVRVTTRERPARQFWSVVSQVGAQVEVLTNSLAYLRQGSVIDPALPVVVDVPAAVSIRPGEVVDLLLRAGDSGSRVARAEVQAGRRPRTAENSAP